jgi:hypothetical protein
MSSVRTIVAWAATLFVVEVLAVASGMIGFHRLQPVENNPFTSPAVVIGFDSNSLTLADGRVVQTNLASDGMFRDELERFRGSIGVAASGTGAQVEILIRRPIFRCGLGLPVIVIPVFRIPCARYREHQAGFGTVVEADADALGSLE